MHYLIMMADEDGASLFIEDSLGVKIVMESKGNCYQFHFQRQLSNCVVWLIY